MPLDTASPSDIFDMLVNTGTPIEKAREALALVEKRRIFELEVARVINRLSLESRFGNRPDFDLARQAWEFLSGPRPEIGQTFTGPPTPPSDCAMGAEAPAERPRVKSCRDDLAIAAMHAAAKAAGVRIVEIATL